MKDRVASGERRAEEKAQKLTPHASRLTPELSWNPWGSVLLVIASFLGATVLAQIVMSIVYEITQHGNSAGIEEWLNGHVLAQFVYTLLAYGFIAAPIVWFLRRKKVGLKTIGLKKPRFSDAGRALLVFPLYFISYGVLLVIVSSLIPSLNVDQKQQIGFDGVGGFGPLLLTFLSLAVIPPLVEEFLMRGFLFTSLRARMKLVSAVIITSLVFAAGHLQFGSGAPLLWVAAIDTFVLSLFLIYLRVKTDSLWASITLHALKNSLAFVYIFLLHKG